MSRLKARGHAAQRQAELQDAREKLRAAEEELSRIKSGTAKSANTFVRPGYSQYTGAAHDSRLTLAGNNRKSFLTGGKSVLSSFFSAASSNLSVDDVAKALGNLELWAGQKGNYLSIASVCIKLLQKLIEDELSSGSSLIAHSLDLKVSRINEKDPGLVIVERTLKIPASVMLLIHLRGELRGKADDMLLYMDEKYAYTHSSRAFLHHSILAFPSLLMLTPRDFFSIAAWDEDEDGTLWVSSQSVNGLLGETAGCIRGVMKVMGMRIRPISLPGVENECCTVTYVASIDPKVWVPRFQFNEKIREMMSNYLEKSESLGMQLLDSNEHEELIDKYLVVEQEVSADEDSEIEAIDDSDLDEIDELDDDELSEYDEDLDDSDEEEVEPSPKLKLRGKKKQVKSKTKRERSRSVRFERGTKFGKKNLKARKKKGKTPKSVLKKSERGMEDDSSSENDLTSDDEARLLRKLKKKYLRSSASSDESDYDPDSEDSDYYEDGYRSRRTRVRDQFSDYDSSSSSQDYSDDGYQRTYESDDDDSYSSDEYEDDYRYGRYY